LVVPFLILGAVWLWGRRGWGYVLAAIMSVKGTVYMLALAAVSVAAERAGFPEATAELPLWGLLSAGFLVAAVVLLGNVRLTQSNGRTNSEDFSA
jgi:hypothetical protein